MRLQGNTMSTTTLTCDATSTPDDWTLIGVSKPLAVATDDGDTTYIRSEEVDTVQAFTLSTPVFDLPFGAVASVISVAVRSVAKQHEATGSSYRHQLAIASDVSESSILEVTDTYATATTPLARPGGGDWTVDDLDGLVVRVYAVSAVTRRVRVTLLVVDVEYEVTQLNQPSAPVALLAAAWYMRNRR